MNKGRFIIFSGILSSLILLSSCKEGNNEVEVNKEGEKKVDKTLLDPNRSFNTTFDGKLFSVPSPIQTALLIQSLSIPFNESLLNDLDSAQNHSSLTDQSINLGIYGADLGYVTLYDQSAKSLNYLSVVEDLANKIGIAGAFDKSFINRFESNSNDEDSMLVILTDGFRKADNFLKENNQKNSSALILTGGWLESMYFATQLYKESKNDELLSRIGEQKQSLETIIELLEKYNANGENDKYLTHFNDLKELFMEIKTSYEYVEPETDKSLKLTTIKSKMNIEISEELANKIIEKIAAVRGEIAS
ncbi:hypothetical protein CW751_03780 [Brumimicrobium salinarum]|uniref:Uncharacterized protein n=1 Tax=Brumimicrobium salinarum TaxID=2058658 RepID=A0A2I0R4Z8_9FLAO|nr:hypothetical protein [Brumimicrobium salinarum]PKR81656.1 hypothetical protein CW751_03780 [Brumimicrobium salinarum]